ncbi:hypothetical protein ACFRMQ_01085 [Kitasatospora sp. NPDC056783]|uniref:hypothetical protein n=1 Tax=Kitasatospora sp. NPDC056783 TaxID=3345943 RepID=UPI0036BFB817
MADLNRLPRRERRQRAADPLTRFDLVDAARKPVATYSDGRDPAASPEPPIDREARRWRGESSSAV